jgi:DNA-binding IclR family transcriptional regulator
MTLKSLNQALEVLEKFTKEEPVWGLRELSKSLDVNHTVIYRILQTFENKRFLVKDEKSKKYQLGPGILSLLSTYTSMTKLSDLIIPEMEKLSEITGESVFLTWRDGQGGTTVEIVESTHNIRFTVSVGTTTPLYIGASTKSIMAFLTKSEQEKILNSELKKRTKKTVTSKNILLKELDEISEKGWAYTEGEYSDDVFGISAPLFNKDNDVIASLTLAGPTYRIDEQKKEDILEQLLKYTEKINEITNVFDTDKYI